MVNQKTIFYRDIVPLYKQMKEEQYMYRYYFFDCWNERRYWEFLHRDHSEERFREFLEDFIDDARIISYQLFCQVLDCMAEHFHFLHGYEVDYGGIVSEFKAQYHVKEARPLVQVSEPPIAQFPRHWQVDF
jgi:hypothetical protein